MSRKSEPKQVLADRDRQAMAAFRRIMAGGPEADDWKTLHTWLRNWLFPLVRKEGGTYAREADKIANDLVSDVFIKMQEGKLSYLLDPALEAAVAFRRLLRGKSKAEERDREALVTWVRNELFGLAVTEADGVSPEEAGEIAYALAVRFFHDMAEGRLSDLLDNGGQEDPPRVD